MKSRFKIVLCLMLVLALSSSLFTISAAATGTYRISVEETCRGMIVHEFSNTVIDSGLSQAIGSFCPGLTYDQDGNYLVVTGTPQSAGTYWLDGTATLIDGRTENYSFTIVVEGIFTPVITEPPAICPEITKNPTGEEMMEGESAMFIARANYAESIEWFLLDPTMTNFNALGYIASLYPGFSFNGRYGEVLEIYNVPLELNGWYAVCVFTNGNQSIESTPAKIRVTEFKAEVPNITTQPQSASKNMGESVLLSVLANNNSSGTLKYQWYMSNTGGSNLNPITGANSSSYTPPQTAGTVYYTVAVWTSYNDRDSAKVYSNPAAVTYNEVKPTATPRPSPIVTTAPSASAAPTTAPSTSMAPSPNANTIQKERNTTGLMLWIIIALLMTAAMATIILLILRKNAKQDTEAAAPVISHIKVPDTKPEAPAVPASSLEKSRQHTSIWQCSCGALNESQFCTQCGKPRFKKRSCSSCGWTPDSPNQIPRFCPECGNPFEQD